MGVDVAGDGVDLFLHGGHFGFVGVLVAPLIQEQQGQKFREFQVNNQIPHGVRFGRQEKDVVELAEHLFLKVRVETEDGDFPVEDAQQALVLVGQARHIPRKVELNNQPLAGISRRVLGPVEYIGRDADDVKGLHVVGLALQDMPGIGPHHDAQLIKGVEVLELHVLVFRTHIVIKEVEQGVVLPVDTDEISVLIQK